jgi:hypothetical protein
MLHENACEEACPYLPWHPTRANNLYPFHPTAGRIALENESAEVLTFESGNTFVSPRHHEVGKIPSGSGCHKSWSLRVTLQVHGLSWNPEPALDLGANRNVFYIASQGVLEEAIQSMAPIIPDRFPKKACADPKPDFLHVLFHHKRGRYLSSS